MPRAPHRGHSSQPCRVCGSTVALLRSDHPIEESLVDQLRVCTNPRCLSNGGAEGAGPEV